MLPLLFECFAHLQELWNVVRHYSVHLLSNAPVHVLFIVYSPGIKLAVLGLEFVYKSAAPREDY